MKTKDELREKCDRMARWYDWEEGLPEIPGIRGLRRALFGRARGKVLEVAAGTGKNFPYHSRGCGITAVDMSPAMPDIARAPRGPGRPPRRTFFPWHRPLFTIILSD